MFATIVSLLKLDLSTVQRSHIIHFVFMGINFILFLHWIWTRRHLYRFAWTFPGEFGWPYVGVLTHVTRVRDVIPTVENAFKKLQNYTLCVWVGPQPTILTADPKFVESVTLSSELLNKMQIYKIYDDMFGNGLLSNKVTQWQQHRKKINPSFSHNVLLSFLPIFHNARNRVITALESMADDNKFYGLTELFLRTSMEISFETVMGKPLKENNKIDHSFVKNFEIIIKQSTWKGILTFLKLDFLYILNFTYNKAHKKYRECVAELLKEKQLEGAKNSLQGQSNCDLDVSVDIKKKPQIFLDNIYNLCQQGVFTLQDVIDESNHILAASFETTAINMFSTLVLIAMHPNVQDRLYEELVNAYPDKNVCLDFDQMDQLPFLDMVIKESMRVFPPVGFIGRRVVQDTPINGCILPKGIEILICIYHIHRRSDIWGPNAHKFDPDHFLPDNERDRPKCAFIPFSHGPRNCIGWRYALFLVKVMISGIVRNYRLDCDLKYEDIEIDLNLTIKFEREPLLRIYCR